MKIKSLLVSAFLLVAGQGQLFAEKNPSFKDQGTVLENDPATVISNYIKAVGGEEKVKSIKNASMTAEANFQGQIIQIKTVADSEKVRLMQSTSVGGNVMQKTILADGKGQMMVMGQVQQLPDETAAMLKPQTFVFPEQFYESMGFKIAYIGTEAVNGEDAHHLQITAPNGMVTNEFYATSSGLKLRTNNATTGDIFYSDYQEVEGIMFPMMLTIKNPMLPVALEAKMVSVKFNQTLSDADFQ